MASDKIHDIESESLLPSSTTQSPKHAPQSPAARILLWTSCSLNILFFVLSIFVFVHWTGNNQAIQSSYETGFKSDLDPVKSEVRVIQTTYTGGVEVDEDGHFFTTHSANQYVGKPSPDIDIAWSKLLRGLNIDLDPTSSNLQGRTFAWPESGFAFTGLEVYHSLHCLNRLRQALYPDYYDMFSNPNDPDREDHIGHCINHLRLAIQCHADLTPMEWKLSGNKVVLNTATQHTCRDFEKIDAWAVERRTRFEDIESVKNGSLIVVD
ncbi:hypothetical protein EJ05DRAFT_500653 [Pseudovirgaria hyperparasitica]|uniref:Tat pathway signal sequence n=1 Tax=Pseudovirgaria hyperparasitica TaxID=470096 RepID=A0A6A6W6G5_9PEZI|nr:uncharacterized protein EJ05DRAFT_500653 [Pseudovirgaria hyperparasitica]KAF2758135.1 hypothetical protein EJ05DRAFT_500653 [Pseudovirgaria hyperparasitica]